MTKNTTKTTLRNDILVDSLSEKVLEFYIHPLYF